MRLVVDTGVLIAALIKDSLTIYLITHFEGELLTISFSDKEIKKYKEYILEKSQTTEAEFNAILKNLMNKLVILDDSIISIKIDEAIKTMENIDIKDAPFVAAALTTKSEIWSDDEHFQKQNKIKAWKTKDLVRFFNK
ncbi:hypothetical protein HY484_00645 [Candidatus Woesearchaeota archaeon]|nr:hypothetical protein [Candidatus Woesearchaeota archaeon]